MTANRGVKKVSERILAPNRGIIVTEKDSSQYEWTEIPAGSKFVNTMTGIEWVKLRDVLIDKADGSNLGAGVIHDDDKKVYRHNGSPVLKPDGTQYTESEVELSEQPTWVPANVLNSGTLCIAKDSMIVEEVFTVTLPDDGDGKMEYKNTEGRFRRFPIMSDGSVVFELEKGVYLKGRNHLEVFIDDMERISRVAGGIKELTENRFALKSPVTAGQKIVARYMRLFRYGNPYPRIFINTVAPDAAEVGDFWIDYDDYINTDIGEFLYDNIQSDEPLDGGTQPAEPSVPDDSSSPATPAYASKGAMPAENIPAPNPSTDPPTNNGSISFAPTPTPPHATFTLN